VIVLLTLLRMLTAVADINGLRSFLKQMTTSYLVPGNSETISLVSFLIAMSDSLGIFHSSWPNRRQPGLGYSNENIYKTSTSSYQKYRRQSTKSKKSNSDIDRC
jgi:hypothetical protein